MLGSVEQISPLWRHARSRDRSGAVDAGSSRAAAPFGHGGPGLSKAHISPLPLGEGEERPPHRLEWYPGAGLLRVVTPYPGEGMPFRDDKSKRGDISEFSPDAQRRLRQFLATIPDAALLGAFMLTLTYPGNSCPQAIPRPEESHHYKRHLDSFGKSLRRRYPAASIVWVLEFQTRGVAHYHALIFGVPAADLRDFRAWIAKRWNQIVGGDADHLKAGTQCDMARSAGGARNYLAKYLSKGNQALNGVKVGRYWGKINKAGIPQAPERVEEITPGQAKLALRVARKLAAKRQWESSWSRLYKAAGAVTEKHLGGNIFASMTLTDFRRLVGEAHRIGRIDMGWIPSWRGPICELRMSRALFFSGVMLAMGGRWKMPRRPRSRNNSTVNLFCNSSSFREALERHPNWKGHDRLTSEGRSLSGCRSTPVPRRIGGRVYLLRPSPGPSKQGGERACRGGNSG